MEFNNLDFESNYNLDYILDNYITNLYIKFKDYNKKLKDEFFKLMAVDPISRDVNIYSLYSLYVMDAIDDELKKDIYFDQEKGYVPIKINHKEGNEYMSNNEIYAVLNELEMKPKKDNICRHIITRVRVLSLMEVWNHKIDCETLIFRGKETNKYKEEFKKYVFNNPKYLKYSHLLKAALDSAKMFEHPDPLPTTLKELQQFLKNPLIYVMLEPYNHINKKDENNFIDDEIIIHKI